MFEIKLIEIAKPASGLHRFLKFKSEHGS